ncbi:MAG TPA: RodZ domain-containing protein [Bryobacteraceae bacterium]|nr:RodZ domain-containing protein [Bryobacteraceae bacterium]
MSVGETLRRERLKRNLELSQISQELKISLRFLEAIEEEQFDKLPGGVFAKSFVRQYARLLELDEDELAAEVQHILEPQSSFTSRPALEPLQSANEIRVPPVEEWVGAERRFSWSSSLPALAGVVVVMLVCSLVYSWWQRSRRPVAAREDTATRVQAAEASRPEQPAPPQATPEQPQPSPSEGTNPTEPAAAAPSPRQPDEHAGAPAAALHPQTEIAKAAPPIVRPGAADAAAPAPNPNAALRVEVTADEPVWVLARTDGKYSFSGTLEPNQTRTVEANDSVLLRLGNAGGVSITFNGKPIGSVGPRGQVRTVQFTSGGFQIAVPKPSLELDDFLR